MHTRCFTFGIGSGASTALVEGLARAGNGTAEHVKEGERLQPKVIENPLISTPTNRILFPTIVLYPLHY